MQAATMVATLLLLLLALTPIQGQTIRAVAVAEAVVRYFPPEARQTILCIGYWETREQPYSNDLVGAAGEVAWPQIHPIHKGRVALLGYHWADLTASVEIATIVARDIWEERGFEAWSTYRRYCLK